MGFFKSLFILAVVGCMVGPAFYDLYRTTVGVKEQMESAGASDLFGRPGGERPSSEDIAGAAKAREDAQLEKERQKQKEFDDLYTTSDPRGFTLSDFDNDSDVEVEVDL